MAEQPDVMCEGIPSDSYIQAYGVDYMEPGCRKRSKRSALSVLLQAHIFRCEPASQECS